MPPGGGRTTWTWTRTVVRGTVWQVLVRADGTRVAIADTRKGADGNPNATDEEVRAAARTARADEFIERVLIGCLRVRHLIIGDDFRFGAKRAGDYAMLDAAGKSAKTAAPETKVSQASLAARLDDDPGGRAVGVARDLGAACGGGHVERFSAVGLGRLSNRFHGRVPLSSCLGVGGRRRRGGTRETGSREMFEPYVTGPPSKGDLVRVVSSRSLTG